MKGPLLVQTVIAKSTQLLILGAGRLAPEVADLISEHPDFALAGFIEGIDRVRCGAEIRGLPVHWIDDVAHLAGKNKVITAIGDPRRRETIQRVVEFGFEFVTLIHGASYVAPSATLGPGTVVAPGAALAADASIGRHVYINRGALIGHHTNIGDYCTIGPGVNISSGCTIGTSAYFGIGATVIDRITIGDGTFVAAGSLVTKSVPHGGRVAGAPARRISAEAK